MTEAAQALVAAGIVAILVAGSWIVGRERERGRAVRRVLEAERAASDVADEQHKEIARDVPTPALRGALLRLVDRVRRRRAEAGRGGGRG